MTIEGNQIRDSNQVKVKISNPSKNISPIEVPMELTKLDKGKPMRIPRRINIWIFRRMVSRD